MQLRSLVLIIFLGSTLISFGQRTASIERRAHSDTLQKLQPVFFKGSSIPDSLKRGSTKTDSVALQDSLPLASDTIPEDTLLVTNDTLRMDSSFLFVDSTKIKENEVIVKPDPFYLLRLINLNKLTKSEALENKYNAALEFDKKVSFNIYRYKNWDVYTDTINPYALTVVPYFDMEPIRYLTKEDINIWDTNWFTGDTTTVREGILDQTNPIEVFVASRNQLISVDPRLATDSWNDLPDPPKLMDDSYLSQVGNINLAYVINDRNEIKAPEKLSKPLMKKSPWKVRGNISTHLSQSQSTYWEKGATNFFSLLGIGTIDAKYVNKNINWENHGELRLGAIRQGEDDKNFRKNEDRIRLGSKLGFKTKNLKKWYYTVNMDFNSQLFNGYSYDKTGKATLVSSFLSPAKMYLSLGMDYKRDKNFSILLSPVTYRLTYVRDTANINQKKYGLDEYEDIRHEFGGYIRSQFLHDITKTINLRSKLYFFTDYTQFPMKIDLDWENIFTFQLTHLITANISFHFLYDDNVLFDVTPEGQEEKEYAKKLQFKELLSIGFNYRF